MHRLELRIPPLVLVALFAAAIVAASVWMPLVRVPVPGHRALAVLLVLAGLGVALAGVVAFRRARTTVNPMAPQRATDGGAHRPLPAEPQPDVPGAWRWPCWAWRPGARR
jgi:hypothetical protein